MPPQPPTKRAATLPARQRRGGDEDGEPGPSALPAGGPLALHRILAGSSSCEPSARLPLNEVVDRMAIGRTRAGLAEVRIGLSLPGLTGVEAQLRAAPGGVEATIFLANGAARAAVEARLSDLSRALEARGLAVSRLQVACRGAWQGDGSRHS